VDYVSNIVPPSFPDGFDVEVFHISTLEKVKKIVKYQHDKEHVTSLLRREKKFKKYNFSLKKDYNNMKLSVDTIGDLKNVKKVFKLLRYDKDFSYKDIIKNKKIEKFFNKKIEMKNILKTKNKKSQIIWKKAKKINSRRKYAFIKKSG
jgi:spore coat polysaccharide biosynthesis protein SpsF (cytidylyltransferase family)